MVCVPSCERASSPYQSHVGPFSFPDLPQRDRSKSVQPGLNPRMCVTLRPGWKRNATGLLVPVVMGTVNLCRVLMSSRRVGVVKGRPRFISLRTDRNLPCGRDVAGANTARRGSRARGRGGGLGFGSGGYRTLGGLLGRARGAWAAWFMALSLADCVARRRLSAADMRCPDRCAMVWQAAEQVRKSETVPADKQD